MASRQTSNGVEPFTSTRPCELLKLAKPRRARVSEEANDRRDDARPTIGHGQKESQFSEGSSSTAVEKPIRRLNAPPAPHYQAASCQVSSAKVRPVSTFFGRHFAAHPCISRSVPTPNSDTPDESFSRTLVNSSLTKTLANDLCTKCTIGVLRQTVPTGTQQTVPFLDVSEHSSVSTASSVSKRDSSTSVIENSGLVLPSMGSYRLLQFREAETQTVAESAEDWSWYPWRTEMLKYSEDVKEGARLPVFVSSMVDPKYLCVTSDVDGSYARALHTMMQEMAECHEDGRLQPFSAVPPADFIVCAWESDVGKWCRGLIVESHCESALVLYLDHGNCAEVNLSNLRQMKLAWMKIDRKAVCVQLEDVPSPSAGRFSEDAIVRAEELLFSLPFRKIFYLTIFRIRLGDFGGRLDIEDDGLSFQSLVDFYRLHGVLSNS